MTGGELTTKARLDWIAARGKVFEALQEEKDEKTGEDEGESKDPSMPPRLPGDIASL